MRWVAFGVFLYLLFKEGNMLTTKRKKIPVVEGQEIIAEVYENRMEKLVEFINWLPPGEHFSERIKDFLLLLEQRYPIILPDIKTGNLSLHSAGAIKINKYLNKIDKLEEKLDTSLLVDREDLKEILNA